MSADDAEPSDEAAAEQDPEEPDIDLSVGEPIVVTDKNGDQHRAVVAELPDEPAGEFKIERKGYTNILLTHYWRPRTIEEDEPVVGVRYVKGVAADGTPLTYQRNVTHYPASRVTSLRVAEGDAGP